MNKLMIQFAFHATLALGLVWRGFALTILWGWFMVPTFGLPQIAVAPAMGISLMAGLLMHQPLVKGPLDKKALLAVMAMKPAAALLVGWLVHLWM